MRDIFSATARKSGLFEGGLFEVETPFGIRRGEHERWKKRLPETEAVFLGGENVITSVF